MNFSEAVIEGTLLKRYKRFFADVQIGNKIEVAHVPNTGSLKGCLQMPQRCLLTASSDPLRKLKFTLQAVQTPSSWVGVNTHLTNFLVEEAIEKKACSPWQNYTFFQREFKINAETRLDFLLSQLSDQKSNVFPRAKKHEGLIEGNRQYHFIEVKNVSMAEGETCFFPDAVTERGQKHLETLMALKAKGYSAEICFVLQRSDCKTFEPAETIDPIYANLLRKAHQQGVIVSAYPCEVSPTGVELIPTPLKIDL